MRIELKHLEMMGESWVLRFELPKELRPYVWRKGSCALNGVSLTINEVEADWFSVCLIPETIKRTNFSKIKVGDRVNFEIDMMARAIVHNLTLIKPDGVI
jgi:riboflavin synthase